MRFTLLLLIGLLGFGFQKPNVIALCHGENTQVIVKRFRIPGYPPLARQARVEGLVRAVVNIRGDGTVESVSNVAGPALLKDYVADALKQWTFQPQGRQPVSLPIEFRYVLRGPEDERNIIHEISGSLPNQVDIVTNPFPSTWPKKQD
jgi:TonB family protein